MKLRLWFFAITLSLITHLCFAVFLLDTTQTDRIGAIADGENGLEIGLGLAGTYATIVPSPKNESPSENEARTESLIEPQKTQHTKQALYSDKKSAQQTSTPDTGVAESIHANTKIQENLTGKDVTQSNDTQNSERKVSDLETYNTQTNETHTESESESESPLTQESTETRDHQHTPNGDSLDKPDYEPPALDRTPIQAATGKSNSNISGAKKGKVKHYYQEIIAWLANYKTYPPLLKKQKKEGVVTVQFTINRNGYVIESHIIQRSGHPKLDTAALDVLTQASPVPAMPKWLKKQTLTLAIPIEYSLITNSAYKE